MNDVSVVTLAMHLNTGRRSNADNRDDEARRDPLDHSHCCLVSV
jgi:hypothetical protein